MRPITAILAWMLLTWPACAQSPLTRVLDQITYSDGSHPSGVAVLSWGRGLDDSNPRKVIAAGTRTIAINNGVVDVSLFPSAAELPPATCIGVVYKWSTGGPAVSRFWYLPVSSVPVTLQQIEGSIACPTQVGVLVAPGQIAPGATGLTQVLTSAGDGFVSWVTGGGGGGGGTPGGINGQVQFNDLGSFGGFTPGGDVTLNRPNFIVTSTNGVAFADSATINTTNAANISSGTLPNARLSGVPNAALANSSITINTAGPLGGGGAVSLGGTLNLTCATCGGATSLTLTGDVTGTGTSTVATTLANIAAGVPMTYVMPTAVVQPSTPVTGSAYVYVDSTSKNISEINDAGIVNHGVQTKAVVASNFLTGINNAGLFTAAQPACGDLSNAAASCSTDATNATNISSGSLAAARLPVINLAAPGPGGVTGNLPITNLNSGTGANGSTFWAGDGTWKTTPGGGTVTNTPGPLLAGHLMVGNGGVDSNIVASLGTSTTVYHGNTLGTGSFGSVVLTTDISGILPFANGGLGTGSNFTNHFFFGNNTGSTAAPVPVQPTFADLAAGTVGALATFPGGDLFCGGVNPQSGTTYTVVASDECSLVTYNNGAAVAVTLPQATTTGFVNRAYFYQFNRGAGAVTITPTTSTINGSASVVLNQNQGALIMSDGTNYSAWVSAAPTGSGTVTNIQTTSPITGGTITATGTIACATCVTSAAAETLNQLVIGQGSQATAVLGSLGTTTTVLHGNVAGPPAFSQVLNSDIGNGTIDLTAKVTGALPILNGGSAATTAAGALINLFPAATRAGDTIYCATYSSGCTSWGLLAGNNSGTQFLSENGSGVTAWAIPTTTFQANGGSTVVSSTLNVVAGSGMLIALANVGGVATLTPSYNSAVLSTHDTIHNNETYQASSNGTTSMTTVSPNKALLAYAAGQCWDFITDTSNPISVSIDSLVPARTFSVRGTATQAPSTGAIRANRWFRGCDNGTNMVVENTQSLTSGNIWIGDTNNVPVPFAPSGDLTMANSGVFTVTKLNNVSFAGTNGHLVSFGAANIPADSGVVAANAVVASSPGVGVAHFAGSTQTVTSSLIVGSDITGAAGQIYAGSGPALTATPALGTDNSTAGTLQLANGSAAAHTIWGSAATTSNTILGFAVVPTTGRLLDCTVASTTCTLHDSGVVTANVVNASAPGVGIAHFAGSTQTVTSSTIATSDIANNAVTSAKQAVVNTRRVCDIAVGDTSGSSAIANPQLGPQKRICFIPAAATIVELDVSADAGTPNVIVAVNHAGVDSNIVSSALATAASGGIACSNAGGTTGIDGATTCSATLQNTSVAAGDYLELVSGSGSTAKFFAGHITYTVN